MDVKGTTWVGNVYQKFEAMCLEVEEVMYQDTINYVENQVQHVGASVKQFYSNVMQDLLPPSSEKVSPFCFTVEQDSDDGICKKPTVTEKNVPSKADTEQLTRNFKFTSDAGEDVKVSPLILVRYDVDNSCRPSGEKGACPGLRSRKLHGQGKYNGSGLGVVENRSEENIIPIGTSRSIGRREKHLSKASPASRELVNEISETSFDQTAKMRSTSIDEDTRPDSIRKSCNQDEKACKFTADLSNDFQSSNEIALIGSTGNNEKEMGVHSSGVVSAESNDAIMCLHDKVASIGESSQNEEVRYDKYADEEIVMCQPDHSTKLFDWSRATDIKTATETGAETIQQTDRSKLEETIVMVNEEDLQCLPQRECKKRPYKKKIRESLYSRMRSGRKHEYKQLALQHGDRENRNHKYAEAFTPTSSMEDMKKLTSRNSCESEWELL